MGFCFRDRICFTTCLMFCDIIKLISEIMNMELNDKIVSNRFTCKIFITKSNLQKH